MCEATVQFNSEHVWQFSTASRDQTEIYSYGFKNLSKFKSLHKTKLPKASTLWKWQWIELMEYIHQLFPRSLFRKADRSCLFCSEENVLPNKTTRSKGNMTEEQDLCAVGDIWKQLACFSCYLQQCKCSMLLSHRHSLARIHNTSLLLMQWHEQSAYMTLSSLWAPCWSLWPGNHVMPGQDFFPGLIQAVAHGVSQASGYRGSGRFWLPKQLTCYDS